MDKSIVASSGYILALVVVLSASCSSSSSNGTGDVATATEGTASAGAENKGAAGEQPAAEPSGADKTGANAASASEPVPATEFAIDPSGMTLKPICDNPAADKWQYCTFALEGPVFVNKVGDRMLYALREDCDACGESVQMRPSPWDSKLTKGIDMGELVSQLPKRKSKRWAQEDFDRVLAASKAKMAEWRFPEQYTPARLVGVRGNDGADKALWKKLGADFPAPEADCQGTLDEVAVYRAGDKLAVLLTYTTHEDRLQSDICSEISRGGHFVAPDSEPGKRLLQAVKAASK